MKKVSKEILKKITKFAQEKMKNADYNHDWNHILMTVNLVKYIARKEKADLEIVEVATYLHDIGYSVQAKNHEEIGAKIAYKFLQELNLSQDFIDKVCHIIEHHKLAMILKTNSLEAKVLYDADKLQVIGVFAFPRMLSGNLVFIKKNLKDGMKIVEKYQKERLESLQTKTAKILIEKDHELMLQFYDKYKLFIEKWGKA